MQQNLIEGTQLAKEGSIDIFLSKNEISRRTNIYVQIPPPIGEIVNINVVINLFYSNPAKIMY